VIFKIKIIRKEVLIMKIAVVGTGYWGKNLVRNFYQLGQLGVVCDTNEKTLKELHAIYPKIKFTSNFTEAIKETSAVVIATPATTHYSLTKKALELGKDVFVEKPLALTVGEGKKLVNLAEKKSLVLMVGHLLEYHPAITKLKALITKGELGKIYYIYSHRLNFGKIRREENILWSFAPHDIAVILRILGKMPAEVHSIGESYITPGVPDVTVSNLFFSGGIQAHIFVSWLNPFKEQKLVVMASKNMVVFDDTGPDKLVIYPHQIDWEEGHLPIANKREGKKIKVKDIEPLKIECKHFLDCINTHKEPLTNGYSALSVLKILEACQESLREGKRISLLGDSKKYFIASTAIIEEGSEIGKGTKIWHYSHVMKGAKIGKNCRIGKYVSVEPGAILGNNVKVQNGVSIYSGVTLEDNVFIGPKVVFTNVKRPRSEFPVDESGYRKTIVKQGATIGANATIICGTTIGEYAFVAAGAIVTKDIPPFTLLKGASAKIVGKVNKKGELIKEKNEK